MIIKISCRITSGSAKARFQKNRGTYSRALKRLPIGRPSGPSPSASAKPRLSDPLLGSRANARSSLTAPP